MNYTSCLKITARTAWATWYQASSVASVATEAALAWYANTFFSERALTRYEEIGKILGFAMVCTVACGMTARILTQTWVDNQVEGALTPTPTPTPLPPLAQRLKALKGPQLRRLCVVKGIEYRNFNGPKKNMKVAQMREALITTLMDQ